MDRKLNYLFLFLLVVVFTTSASVAQQWNILLGLFFATAFGFLAFLLNGLALDGMFASIVVGGYVFGLGGWDLTVVVLLFFVSSSAIVTAFDSPQPTRDDRRDGLQVWANGFWLVVFLVLSVFFNGEVLIFGAVAAVAAATADTWATELGSTARHSTYLITNFSTVEPGTDGGVSFKGTIAALAGAASIGAVALYVFSLHFYIFLCIFVAGFLGCVLDSYFGAVFQRNNRSVKLPVAGNTVTIDNNIVNAAATGAGALLAIILKLLLA